MWISKSVKNQIIVHNYLFLYLWVKVMYPLLASSFQAQQAAGNQTHDELLYRVLRYSELMENLKQIYING